MDGAGKAFLLDTSAYLALAAQSLVRRSILMPAILFLLLLMATDVVALVYPPVPGTSSMAVFALNVTVRAVVVLVFSVVMLRLAVNSARRAWMPDGGFWLYLLLTLLIGSIPLEVAIRLVDVTPPVAFLVGAARLIIFALVAPWLAAVAVERPLAWRATDWLRRFQLWFPYQLLWVMLLSLPLLALQQLLPPGDFILTPWFWPIIVIYSIIGFLLLMIRLGLDVAAYRCVAQD